MVEGAMMDQLKERTDGVEVETKDVVVQTRDEVPVSSMGPVVKDDGQIVGGGATQQGATAGRRPETKDGGGATPVLRMVNDVLVDPKKDVAPTKRRRGKAKRSTCSKPQGTIKEYFSLLNVPKEWSTILKNEGTSSASTMLEGARLRKRKGDDLLVEDLRRQTMSRKSQRLLVEDDGETRMNANSRT